MLKETFLTPFPERAGGGLPDQRAVVGHPKPTLLRSWTRGRGPRAGLGWLRAGIGLWQLHIGAGACLAALGMQVSGVPVLFYYIRLFTLLPGL